MNKNCKSNLIYIKGKKVFFRPLLEDDFTLEYLNWLNDPEVNAFSQRRPFPVSWDEMKQYNNYFSKNPGKGFVLAIFDINNGIHIGNISLVNIQQVHSCAEIAILIGNKKYWNQGYGSECIYLLTKHSFQYLNLNRIFSGSFNPSFVRCVEKLGWIKEGEFRERIWSNGRYHNQIWMAILKSDFKLIDIYEENENENRNNTTR